MKYKDASTRTLIAVPTYRVWRMAGSSRDIQGGLPVRPLPWHSLIFLALKTRVRGYISNDFFCYGDRALERKYTPTFLENNYVIRDQYKIM